MHPRNLILVLLLSLTSACATAQTGQLHIPAYAHLARAASDSTNVNVSGGLLKFAAHFAQDPAAKELLAQIEGVQVRSFEFASDDAYSGEDVEVVRKQLTSPNWTQVVKTRNHSQREDVDVFICVENGVACGLAVIVAEPREFTVVNVVGRLSIDKLAALEHQIGMHGTLAAD